VKCNQNTLKLSYSCMGNVKTVISNHNKAELNNELNSSDEMDCNYRNMNSCPLDRNCNVRNSIYQADVTTPESKETYIGLCNTTFKERYRNYTCSFRNKWYRNLTELSKHIWNLKYHKINYEIKWRKVKQAKSYSNINKKM